MEEAKLTQLDGLLGLLRKHGVRRFMSRELDAGPLELSDVEFFEPALGPAAEQTQREVVRELTKLDEPVCPCGHADAEHNTSGECLLGCEPHKCQPT